MPVYVFPEEWVVAESIRLAISGLTVIWSILQLSAKDANIMRKRQQYLAVPLSISNFVWNFFMNGVYVGWETMLITGSIFQSFEFITGFYIVYLVSAAAYASQKMTMNMPKFIARWAIYSTVTVVVVNTISGIVTFATDQVRYNSVRHLCGAFALSISITILMVGHYTLLKILDSTKKTTSSVPSSVSPPQIPEASASRLGNCRPQIPAIQLTSLQALPAVESQLEITLPRAVTKSGMSDSALLKNASSAENVSPEFKMHRSLSRLSKRIRPSVKTAEVRRMKMQNFRKKTIIFLIVWPLVALFGVPMFLWTGYVQARSRESYSKAADAHAVRFNLRMEFNQYGHIVFILVVLYLNYNEFPLVKKFLSTFGGFIRLVYGRK